MSSKDVITFKQETITFIEDEKRLNLFGDDNLNLMIKFLIHGPLTISDFRLNFEKIGEKKSDKSIYRYLQQLIKAKLVAKGGKRITTTQEQDLISETLFIRTAQVFILLLPVFNKKASGEINSPFFDTLFYFIKDLYGKKDSDLTNFRKFMAKLDEEKDKHIVDLFEKADQETLQKINALDRKYITYALNASSWVAVALKHDLLEELKKL